MPCRVLGCHYASCVNVYEGRMTAQVNFLRGLLGPSAVPCPLMNIGSAFSDVANTALDTTLEPAFSPYADDMNFLLGKPLSSVASFHLC